jgi:hypothetical protein
MYVKGMVIIPNCKSMVKRLASEGTEKKNSKIGL